MNNFSSSSSHGISALFQKVVLLLASIERRFVGHRDGLCGLEVSLRNHTVADASHCCDVRVHGADVSER